MACSFIFDDEILEVKTSGQLDLNERLRMLKLIASVYDNCRAKAIIVDHRQAEIECSKEDAINFGVLIDFMFIGRWPCFIAVLTDADDPALELIDLSVFKANSEEGDTVIKSFMDEKAARKAVAAWLKEQDGDIAVLP